jgi:hypothetical protein
MHVKELGYAVKGAIRVISRRIMQYGLNQRLGSR